MAKFAPSTHRRMTFFSYREDRGFRKRIEETNRDEFRNLVQGLKLY